MLFNQNAVIIAAGVEVVFYQEIFDANTTRDQTEINGFGLNLVKKMFSKPERIFLNQFSNQWLRVLPTIRLTKIQNIELNESINLHNHRVSLSFGAFLSPYQFKCAHSTIVSQSKSSLFFSKNHSQLSINIDSRRFTLKRDHIDNHRGIIIDQKKTSSVNIYICLRGNLEEYDLYNQENGRPTRRFYLQNLEDSNWQTCFSTLRLSIQTRNNSDKIYTSLCYLIEFFNHHSIPIYFGSIRFRNENVIFRNQFFNTPSSFLCQYSNQMIFSLDCGFYEQMNNIRLKNLLQNLSNGNNDELLYYAMERLRRLVHSSQVHFLNIANELEMIIDHYSKFYVHSIFYQINSQWDNYVRIPWFCLTPTRLIVKPFKFMRSNRVFRYLSNLDRCMAFVEFRDETGSAFLSKELIPFLKYYLENGFEFGGRKYLYLHHAQSQIRNKQFYFYCESEGGISREELEEWMGNFDEEKSPAKNTARRTQPFSSTDPTIEISEDLVERILDVMTEDGKYNFTDGVGQISSELNKLIHESLGIYGNKYRSSVLQIRYGGCKGTLAVNPDLDKKSKQLLIRKSMVKFTCHHRILELCKRSLLRRLYLNREVLNLLAYRGISSVRLLSLQLENILWLIRSLSSNQSAVSVLREKCLSVLPWADFSHHLNLAKEPFFRQLLLTTIGNNLHQLVTRAHIRVSEARYMFGTVDEYKVLNEGQVFVQITNDDGTRTVLKGPIAITKNPCRHPGDLRVLEAVDDIRLHHLYDVLVFPQKGSRPHANQISGSDLDGDEYSVIWNPYLVPSSENPEPYNYDSQSAPKPLDRVVTRDDRLQVILNICEQDNLGRLSNIHLVVTDRFGIDHTIATDLAAGLSQELDSVKSSHHPYMLLQINNLNLHIGNSRPDFMQMSDHVQYQSDKILGKLFRSAYRLNETFSKVCSSSSHFVSLDDTLHEDYAEYLPFARYLYKKYQNEMLEIIGFYGFTNEIDLFCCCESRNMNANDRSDVQQTARVLLEKLFKQIQNEFYEQIDSDFRAQAAVCYYVAYTDETANNKRMLSFPWLFASELLDHYDNFIEDEPIDDSTELYLQLACKTGSEEMINLTEKSIEQLIEQLI